MYSIVPTLILAECGELLCIHHNSTKELDRRRVGAECINAGNFLYFESLEPKMKLCILGGNMLMCKCIVDDLFQVVYTYC